MLNRVFAMFPPRRERKRSSAAGTLQPRSGQRLQRITDMKNGQRVNFPNDGFTLVELILALFFFAIVTAIAIPSFRGYIDNTKLKGATRQIMSDIYDVQLRSKSENAQYRITLNADPANTYVLERVTAPARTQTKTLSEHGSDMQITATTFTSNQMNFQARGILSEDNRTITLRNNRNSTAVISVSLTGRANAQFTLQ
jgi:prepilin-type N-terminal cleavage/methylation domain-containing protein